MSSEKILCSEIFKLSVYRRFSFQSVHQNSMLYSWFFVWGSIDSILLWFNAFSEFLTFVKVVFVYNNITTVCYIRKQEFSKFPDAFSFCIHYCQCSGIDECMHHEITMSILKLSISSMLATAEDFFSRNHKWKFPRWVILIFSSSIII